MSSNKIQLDIRLLEMTLLYKRSNLGKYQWNENGGDHLKILDDTMCKHQRRKSLF